MGLDFGFSTFGRPVRGLKLFTSLYVAHKLIIIYVAQNVKSNFMGKRTPHGISRAGVASLDVYLVLRLNRYLGGGKYFVCISIVKSDRNLVV